MRIDVREYERHLEAARLRLSARFDEDKIKRDPKGRFARKLAEIKEATGVSVHGSADEDGVRVGMIKVDPESRGEGRAAAALRMIEDFADEHALPIALTPEPVGDGGLSAKQLKDWYGRRGFKPNKGRAKDHRFSDTMIRPEKGS